MSEHYVSAMKSIFCMYLIPCVLKGGNYEYHLLYATLYLPLLGIALHVSAFSEGQTSGLTEMRKTDVQSEGGKCKTKQFH